MSVRVVPELLPVMVIVTFCIGAPVVALHRRILPEMLIAAGVGVVLGVGVGDAHPVTILTSTVLVSAVPLYPPTTTRRLPIVVPDVKECATFVFGPDDQLSVAML